MSITIRTLAISFLSVGIFAAAFLGAVHAQTPVRTTGCVPACTGDKLCYQTSSSVKQCLSPGALGQESPATPTQPAGQSSGGTLQNPLKVDSLNGLLNIVLDAVINIGVIVLVLALVYVGFLFVFSRGNPENISKARVYFFWIVIGGLLVLGAKGLSEVIQSTATSL